MYYTEKMDAFIEHTLSLEQLAGKHVLITGATGLIGLAIVDILHAYSCTSSQPVYILAAARNVEKAKARFKDYVDSDFFRIVEYDACKALTFDFHADYIIHAASNAHPAVYVAEPVQTMIANFTGLNRLLDYAQEVSAARLLYVSSSEVYGKNEHGRPYKEDDYGFVDLLNARASYPSAKRAAETLCAAYTAQYGLETVIVRPGHIYGPTMTQEDSRASAQFARDAVEGRNIIMKSAGSQLRSYCYAYDCASAILSVLTTGEAAQAYNIAGGDCELSIFDLATLFAQCAGVQVERQIATEAEKQGYNLMDTSALNGDKLAALGWSSAITPREGAMETVVMLRKQAGI